MPQPVSFTVRRCRNKTRPEKNAERGGSRLRGQGRSRPRGVGLSGSGPPGFELQWFFRLWHWWPGASAPSRAGESLPPPCTSPRTPGAAVRGGASPVLSQRILRQGRGLGRGQTVSRATLCWGGLWILAGCLLPGALQEAQPASQGFV